MRPKVTNLQLMPTKQSRFDDTISKRVPGALGA
jgi:hypothetical protein